MALSNSQLRRLNHKFGEAVGFNPHGQPNFKWVRTEAMFRYVDYSGAGFRPRESGLLVYGKNYTPRPWSERYGKCWILAKWKQYTESEWYQITRGSIPFPKLGDWEPVENVRLGPEYKEHEPDPDERSTADAIAAILADRARIDVKSDPASMRRHIEARERELVEEADAAHKKVVSGKLDQISAELDDLVPAFGKLPGSHGGATEFMSGH